MAQDQETGPGTEAEGALEPVAAGQGAETLHTETGAAYEAEDGGGTFPPFDPSTYPSQLLWLAITFGLLYYLMSKVALPRISDILEVRRDRIADDIAEAERLKRETDDAIATYEQALAEAKSKAHAIAHDTRKSIGTEIEEKRKAIDAENAEKMAEAEKRIDATRETALENVSEIAVDATQAIVKQLIGGRTAKKDIEAAVSSALRG